MLDARSILDWNLDGRVDFIDFRHAAPTSVEVLTYPGYQPAPINSNPRPSCDEPSTAGIVSFSVGDANGDGLPEIIGCAAGSTATSPLDHAVILNRSTLDPAVTTDYFSASTTFCTDTWADMDGDGIAEPVKRSTDPNNVGIVTAKLRADLRTATETTFSLPLGLPRFDLNGDGLDDVLASDTSTIVHIWLNTGNGFTEVPGGIYLIPPRLMAFAVGADLDHDGRDEVLIPLTDQVAPSELMSNANTWGVYDYEPSGLVLRAYIDTGAWAAIHPPSTFTPDYSNAVLGDFDGDGNLDFAVTGDHDDSDNLPVRVLRGQNGTSNLLKSVTDGMGKRIDISYSNAVYTPGSNCSPLRCETHPPNVVVSNHTISETDATGTLGTKTEQTYDYTYQDARTDLQNQRYLGFSKRTINERSGLLNLRYTEIYLDNSTSELGNEYPFAGHRTLVRVTDQDTAPILSDPQTISSRVTETEFNWQPHFGAGTTVTPLLNFSEMRLIDRARVGFEGAPVDNRVLTVHYAYQYDPVFNNLRHTTRSETTNTTLATKDVDVVYHAETSFLNDWLISLPETKTVTDSVVAAGQTTTTTRVESYSYYPYGALQQTIREPNDAYYRLQTDIGRDPYGNALTVTETSADSPAGPAQVRGQSFMYDADQAYPLTITNALGQVSYLDFDRRFGKRTLFADPNGIATQWAYDGFGREAVRQTPVTQTITQYLVPIDSPSVSARAVLKASSESTGYGVNVTYLDALGRTVKRDVTGLLGATVTTETAFDDAGRPAQRSRPHLPGDASQGIEQVTYDDSGQPAFVTLADQNTIQYGYATRATVDPATLGLTALPDNYVFFTSLTDPNGNTSINVVDQRGLLVASRDPNGSWVSVQHGPFGTTTTATAVTSTTQITPDKYGRTDTSVDPDRGTEHYVYNAWGQVQRYYTGAPLQHIRLVFDHDDLGRVTSVTGASSTATYTYDNAGDGGPNEIGRLVSTTSLDGSRRDYHYEAPILAGNRGFVASVTDTVAGQSMATSFSYNASGQVETVTYPGGDDPFEIQYQYDAGGHLAEIGNPGFSEVYWQLTGAHQGQRPATEVIGAYTTVKGYYDDTGLLQSITTIGAPVDGTNPTIQEVAFDYDPNGNLRDRTYYVGDTGTEEFVPDSLNRLTSVTKDGVSTFEAGYLTNGNIDTLTGTNGNFTYIFPTSGPVHAPYQGGNATHEYDATGNLQTRQGDSIVGSTQITTVDDFNRPIRVNFQNPAGSVEYDYQTTGERSRKSLSSGTEVLYSGDYERTTTAAGIEHKYRIVSPSGPVMEVSRDDTGQELSRVFLYLDPRGSPEVITDAAGNVLHQQRFSPFGMVDSPSWESTNPAVRRVTRGFGGHEHDPETGLVNMGARLYDPTIGSFASPDFGVQIPSWTQAYNRYSYGWNNPMNWVDPFGLQNESTFPDQTTEPGDVVIPPDVINATPPDVSTAPTSEPTADPLAEFSPEGAAGTSEAPTPMTVGPQPGADEERIRRILQDASDPDCVAASCGPRPDEFAFENTSNELNQPPTDAEVQRQEAWAERVRELTKSDRPLTPELTASDVAAVIPAVRTALGVERLVVEGLGIGAETVNNPIPKTLARVIPANISPTTLGKIGEADVFVTDAEAMSGLGARQIAKALGIPESSSGFNVYEFSSEGSSIASPINRLNPGFVGRGMTSGGAPEFVIPNGPIPAGAPRFVR
ncbi:MAG TPA: polymorphic toxin type 10 domain-containing protein [Polyangiaceae bacterium]|nr:polymorphic toxin type 10 domain-containing protein [Polyangiaceae bacterium]